eukprot:3137457-Rhodomonas_salina.3
MPCPVLSKRMVASYECAMQCPVSCPICYAPPTHRLRMSSTDLAYGTRGGGTPRGGEAYQVCYLPTRALSNPRKVLPWKRSAVLTQQYGATAQEIGATKIQNGGP